MGSLLFFGVLVAVLVYKHREVIEAIENFSNNFPRGGPPTPMHPSPVNDAAFLRRRQHRTV